MKRQLATVFVAASALAACSEIHGAGKVPSLKDDIASCAVRDGFGARGVCTASENCPAHEASEGIANSLRQWGFTRIEGAIVGQTIQASGVRDAASSLWDRLTTSCFRHGSRITVTAIYDGSTGMLGPKSRVRVEVCHVVVCEPKTNGGKYSEHRVPIQTESDAEELIVAAKGMVALLTGGKK